MLNPASKAAASRTRVEVLTVDAVFERTLRDAFSLGGKVDLDIVSATLAEREDSLGHDGVTVVVVDIDGGDAREMAALERLADRLAGWPPLVVVDAVIRQGIGAPLRADANRRFPGIEDDGD